MMTGWVVIAVGVCIVWWYLSARQRSEQQKRDELYELQFWEPDDDDDTPNDVFVSMTVHFPSMLLRYRFASMGLDTYRLYLLRRRGDGEWERMFTHESFECELEDKRSSIFQKDELATLEKEGNVWRTINVPTMETAYQRFIHAQGVPVVNVAADWKAEEAKTHARERKQREPIVRSSPGGKPVDTTSAAEAAAPLDPRLVPVHGALVALGYEPAEIAPVLSALDPDEPAPKQITQAMAALSRR